MEVYYRSVGNCKEQFGGSRSNLAGQEAKAEARFQVDQSQGARLEGVLLKTDPYHQRLQVPVLGTLQPLLQRDDLEICSTLLQLSLPFVPAVRVKARPSAACTG